MASGEALPRTQRPRAALPQAPPLSPPATNDTIVAPVIAARRRGGDREAAHPRGQCGRVARLLGAIEGLPRAAETRLLPFDQERVARDVAALRVHPDAATLDRARAEGQAFSPERALAYAQEGDRAQEPAGEAPIPPRPVG